MQNIYAKILGVLFLGAMFAGVTYVNFSKPAVGPVNTITNNVEVVPESKPEPQQPAPKPEPVEEPKQVSLALGPTVVIAGTKIGVEVATTNQAVTKGLSGRLYLPADKGMLFIFSKPDLYRFWMPDMHFAIDIVWIQAGKVVAINSDVSPVFDPEHPVLYSPPRPVQYVLELNAGFANRNGLKAGDEVSFKGLIAY